MSTDHSSDGKSMEEILSSSNWNKLVINWEYLVSGYCQIKEKIIPIEIIDLCISFWVSLIFWRVDKAVIRNRRNNIVKGPTIILHGFNVMLSLEIIQSLLSFELLRAAHNAKGNNSIRFVVTLDKIGSEHKGLQQYTIATHSTIFWNGERHRSYRNSVRYFDTDEKCTDSKRVSVSYKSLEDVNTLEFAFISNFIPMNVEHIEKVHDVRYKWDMNETEIDGLAQMVISDKLGSFRSPDNFGMEDIFFLKIGYNDEKLYISLNLRALPFPDVVHIKKVNVILESRNDNKRKIWRARDIKLGLPTCGTPGMSYKRWMFDKHKMLKDLLTYSLVIELQEIECKLIKSRNLIMDRLMFDERC